MYNYKDFIMNESMAGDIKKLKTDEFLQSLVQLLKDNGYKMLNDEKAIDLAGKYALDYSEESKPGTMYYYKSKYGHEGGIHVNHKQTYTTKYGNISCDTFILTPKRFYAGVRDGEGVAEIQGACYQGLVDVDLKQWIDGTLKP